MFFSARSIHDEILELKNEFYKPRDLGRANELDRIQAAILQQNAMAMDSGYVDDVTRYRFQYSTDSDGGGGGTDVLALDILRGRDHGLRRYIEYVRLCSTGGRTAVQSWDDLRELIDDKVCIYRKEIGLFKLIGFYFGQNLDRLKSVYSSVDEIDLIIGAISERPKLDATVGPTFVCIIGI